MRYLLLRIVVITLTFADVFYLFGLRYNPAGTIDNFFVVFFVSVTIVFTIKFVIPNFKKEKSGAVFIYALLFIYSIYVALNFFNDKVISDLITYFSHQATLPALFLPLGIWFGTYTKDIRRITNTLYLSLIISVLALYGYLYQIGVTGVQHFTVHIAILYLLLLLTKPDRKIRIGLYILTLSFVVLHYQLNNRSLFVLSCLVLVIGYHQKIFINRGFKYVLVILIVSMVYMFYNEIQLYINYYLLANGANGANQIAEIMRNRTFVYVQFFEDMSFHELIFGRGIMGYHFSEYFLQNPGTTHKRIAVEPGALTVILKGGLILLSIYTVLTLRVLKISKGDFPRIRLLLFIIVVGQLIFSIFNVSLLAFMFWYLIGYIYSE